MTALPELQQGAHLAPDADPKQASTADEYLALVGALGVLVGLALATTD